LVCDCAGQFPIGELSPGDGFRPVMTRGDDGGRHRRRRLENRVFMSWRFDRPDFLDLESHSWCRTSGPDGRYFPPPEVTPLIVVLQLPRPLHESKPSGSRQRYSIAFSNGCVTPCEWLLQILSRSMFAVLQRFARYSWADNLDSLGLLQQAQKVLSGLHACCQPVPRVPYRLCPPSICLQRPFPPSVADPPPPPPPEL